MEGEEKKRCIKDFLSFKKRLDTTLTEYGLMNDFGPSGSINRTFVNNHPLWCVQHFMQEKPKNIFSRSHGIQVASGIELDTEFISGINWNGYVNYVDLADSKMRFEILTTEAYRISYLLEGEKSYCNYSGGIQQRSYITKIDRCPYDLGSRRDKTEEITVSDICPRIAFRYEQQYDSFKYNDHATSTS